MNALHHMDTSLLVLLDKARIIYSLLSGSLVVGKSGDE